MVHLHGTEMGCSSFPHLDIPGALPGWMGATLALATDVHASAPFKSTAVPILLRAVPILSSLKCYTVILLTDSTIQ